MAADFYDAENYVTSHSLGYLLRQTMRLLEPRAEALFADESLSFTQWLALRLVHDGIADNSAGLARTMCHNSGAVTRLVDQLEGRGLLERRRCGKDRRIVRLAIAPAGDAALAAVSPRVMALLNSLLEDFSHGEIETLLSLLGRLLARMEADEAKETGQ